jgi:hypothetical protein
MATMIRDEVLELVQEWRNKRKTPRGHWSAPDYADLMAKILEQWAEHIPHDLEINRE